MLSATVADEVEREQRFQGDVMKVKRRKAVTVHTHQVTIIRPGSSQSSPGVSDARQKSDWSRRS
jgi:hypothetical protein